MRSFHIFANCIRNRATQNSPNRKYIFIQTINETEEKKWHDPVSAEDNQKEVYVNAIGIKRPSLNFNDFVNAVFFVH